MKYIPFVLAMSVVPFDSSAQDIEKLKGLTIQPVEKLAQQQITVEINGEKYRKPFSKTKKGLRDLNSDGLPSVISGEVVYSEDGFNEYLITGEIIVKLSNTVDFSEFNKQHNLSVKQAYKNFYILKSESTEDLATLVKKLKAMPNVMSATIDLVDKNIHHF